MTENTRCESCSDCGAILEPENHFTDNAPSPCCQCGSSARTVHLKIHEGIKLHETIKGKVKDKAYPSNKNPRVEFFSGEDLCKTTGKWMNKERYINKNEDMYREIVANPENGQVLHSCEEPLSKHINHGSAKAKPLK